MNQHPLINLYIMYSARIITLLQELLIIFLQTVLITNALANWLATPCRPSLSATAVPWQWAEHVSFVPTSIRRQARESDAEGTPPIRSLAFHRHRSRPRFVIVGDVPVGAAYISATFIRRTKLWPAINSRFSLQRKLKALVKRTNVLCVSITSV